MIKTYKDYNNEFLLRNQEKNISGLLKSYIFQGTNCSKFETEAIVSGLMKILSTHLPNRIKPGQILYTAVTEEAPPGKNIEECPKKTIRLTLLDNEQDKVISQKEKRQEKIIRMADEALSQGALLTQEDLANILNTDVRTIRRDIQQINKTRGEAVVLRGVKKDIGRSVSHKLQIIEQYLEGKTAVELEQSTHHSLRSIERYLEAFGRVSFLYRKKTPLNTLCQIAHVSKTLAKEYIAIYKKNISDISKFNRILELTGEKYIKKNERRIKQ